MNGERTQLVYLAFEVMVLQKYLDAIDVSTVLVIKYLLYSLIV